MTIILNLMLSGIAGQIASRMKYLRKAGKFAKCGTITQNACTRTECFKEVCSDNEKIIMRYKNAHNYGVSCGHRHEAAVLSYIRPRRLAHQLHVLRNRRSLSQQPVESESFDSCSTVRRLFKSYFSRSTAEKEPSFAMPMIARHRHLRPTPCSSISPCMSAIPAQYRARPYTLDSSSPSIAI